MLKIFHVPGTRSVRPVWLCFELDLSVKVEHVDFSPEYRNSKEWRAISPARKVPALIDGDLTMFESGAMVNYILERYAQGRLHPNPGTDESALFHQWCWFGEATLTRPLGLHRILRAEDDDAGALIAEAVEKAHICFDVIEEALADRDYLLGEAFSAADVMMGHSIALLETVIGNKYPNTKNYLERMKARPAYQRVMKL